MAEAPADAPKQEAAPEQPASESSGMSDADAATELAAEAYRQLMSEVEVIFDSAVKGGRPDPEALMKAVKLAYDSLRTGDSLLTETVRQRSNDYSGRCERPIRR